MAIRRDDRSVQDGLGRALAGAQVYWCTQPASTTDNPPSPLATVYSDIAGSMPITQPVLTDGFGHADAYMDDSILYTVVVWHPLFGPYPIVYTDQNIGGGGGGGSSYTPFAGTLTGTIDGTNRVFTLTNNGVPLTTNPVSGTTEVWLNFPLIPGVGYSLTGVTVTFANAPQPAAGSVPADTVWAQGWLAV